MTTYVKYISETTIEYPPKNKGDILNYNLDFEQLIIDGYKEFVEAEKEIGKSYTITYRETKTQVIETAVEIVPDPEEVLRAAKEARSKENDEKGEFARENQFFALTLQDKVCTFQTTRKTQQDLLTAKDFVEMTGEAYQWFTDNNQEIYLSMEEILTISALFMQKANIYPVWSAYKTQIDEAETVEEVEAITIDYENIGE